MEEAITIERLSYGPDGVGHLASGKTIFVPGTVPGDVVLTKVVEEKSSYARGTMVELLEPSCDRVSNPCPNPCGGCSWAHVAYPVQLAFKRAALVDALAKAGNTKREDAEVLVGSICPSPQEWGYRNKIELAAQKDARGQLQIGYYQEGTNNLVVAKECPVAQAAMQSMPKALAGALRYLVGQQDVGLFRVGVRSSKNTRSLEVALWTTPGPFPRAAAKKLLTSAHKPTSIVRVMADEGAARKVKKVEVLSGKGYWEEELADCRFLVSAPSFFQVNTAQAETMIDLVKQGLGVSEGDYLIDLYAGCGTFSIPFAKEGIDVSAVEYAGSSVRDLRRNAERNNVDIEVIGGDAARELPLLDQPDALVVDPPRSGLSKEAIQAIAEVAPRRVAYVSCDPQTWARDVARLQAKGFRLTQATPVDLFPQTYHVETVSFFDRN